MELESLRSDNSFQILWAETEQFASKEDILSTNISRARKIQSTLGGNKHSIILPKKILIFLYTIYTVYIIINDIKTKFEENNLKNL